MITISGTATSGTYVATTPALADGDEITIKCVPSGTPTVTTPSISWDFNSTTAAQSIYGCGNVNGPIAIDRTNRVLFAIDVSNWNAANAVETVACPGNITKATIKLDVDVTASGSVTFTITKNGVDQDGSGGTPDTRITFTTGTTKASATFTLAVAAGDLLTWKCVRTSAPATIRPILGVRLVSTINGQSQFGAPTTTSFSSSAVEYWFPGEGQNTAGDATEANRAVTLGITGFWLTNLYAGTNLSPGTPRSYTFALRKNSGAAGSSVVIADAAIAAHNGTAVQYAAGDTVTLQVTPTNTPTVRAGGIATIQSQDNPNTSVPVPFVDGGMIEGGLVGGRLAH